MLSGIAVFQANTGSADHADTFHHGLSDEA
jgi:hypothetical protein